MLPTCRCCRPLHERSTQVACLGVTGPSAVRSFAVGRMPSRSRAARSRCVPLPRVASGRLGDSQIGCDLQTNRSGSRAPLAPLRKSARSKQAPCGLSRRGGVAIDRHYEELTLRMARLSVNAAFAMDLSEAFEYPASRCRKRRERPRSTLRDAVPCEALVISCSASHITAPPHSTNRLAALCHSMISHKWP